MIRPQARLLFWFAVVVLPFSVLGALVPEATVLALLLIGGLVGIGMVDAISALPRLEGITLELPPLLRTSTDRSANLAVTIKNRDQGASALRVGLALPAGLESAHEHLDVLLPPGAGDSWIEWPFRPGRRGRYSLRHAYLETHSRLGLWAIRRSLPVHAEVRVYPNLLRERKRLASVFLNRGTFGQHAQRQVGKGRDFEKLREYIPGDSYDEIHWKATARRGHPITKVFQIERTQEVYVIIDASRLSGRAVETPAAPGAGEGLGLPRRSPQGEGRVLDRYLAAGLILGQTAERQGDRFGVITFTDQVQTFLRAGSGTAHYHNCREALYTLQAEGLSPDFDEISAFIGGRLRRRALLVFLTALDDPVLAEGFVRSMRLLARRHLVLVSMLKPAGASPLFSQSDVETVDDLYRQLGGHLQWHTLRELEKVLQRQGVHFALLENEHLTGSLISQYVGVKQRQLL